MYVIKAHYYADSDQFGETFVVTSDNGEKDLRLEVGTKVKIVALCTQCDEPAILSNGDGTCICGKCLIKKRHTHE